MDYSRSLKWLDELAAFGIKTGTGHTEKLSASLGSPHLEFPSVLIAGTNGKGSTSAFLESILRQSGYRTGLFTSPHLVDVRERIRIGGEQVSEEVFASAITAVKKAFIGAEEKGIVDEAPTFFEALTLAAFHLFASEKVDMAVVEAGMGGRNDCTNILDPILSIVTNVSMDHQQYLGDTLEKIAAEKAGVFRRGRPAIIGRTSATSEELLKKEAERTKPDLNLRSGWNLIRDKRGWRIGKEGAGVCFPVPPLPGVHQLDNAALAAIAAISLRKEGFDIPDESIEKGIGGTVWPGRLQKISGRPAVYLDGAHNLDGCSALSEFSKKLKGRKVLVFSGMADKPLEAMLACLAPGFDETLLTTVPMKRAAGKDELIRRLKYFSGVLVEDPVLAVAMARDRAGAKGSVVVAGSLYLVGYILKHLEEKEGSAWGTGL